LNTQQPPSASRTPHASAEEPTAEESLSTHAKRALLTRVHAKLTAVLDAGIALLQGLRKKAGGAQDTEESEDGGGARRDRPRERQGSATPRDEAAVDAPKPKRRLRALLIYVSVMLAGGVGGGALAYNQFQKQLALQLEESERLEAALAKKTRPSAELRKSFEDEQARRAKAEKKMASALAEYTKSTADSYNLLENLLGQQLAESRRQEAALAENAKSSAETQKALEEEQARRTETDAKLALSLIEHSKSTNEKQKQLDAVEKQLATLLAGEGARSVQREAPANRRSDDRKNRPARSGNCDLGTKNVDALKACLEDFNQ